MLLQLNIHMASQAVGSRSGAGAAAATVATKYSIKDLNEALTHAVIAEGLLRTEKLIKNLSGTAAAAAVSQGPAAGIQGTTVAAADGAKLVTEAYAKDLVKMIPDADFTKFATAFVNQLQDHSDKLVPSIAKDVDRKVSSNITEFRKLIVQRVVNSVTAAMMKTEMHLSMLRLGLMEVRKTTADAQATFNTERMLRGEFEMPTPALEIALTEDYAAGTAAIEQLLNMLQLRLDPYKGLDLKYMRGPDRAWLELYTTICNLVPATEEPLTAEILVVHTDEKLVSAFQVFAETYTEALQKWLLHKQLFKVDGKEFHVVFPIAKATFGMDNSNKFSAELEPFISWKSLMEAVHELAGIKMEEQEFAFSGKEIGPYGGVLLRFQDAWAAQCLQGIFSPDFQRPAEYPLLESQVEAITRIAGAAVAHVKECAANRPIAAATAARAEAEGSAAGGAAELRKTGLKDRLVIAGHHASQTGLDLELIRRCLGVDLVGAPMCFKDRLDAMRANKTDTLPVTADAKGFEALGIIIPSYRFEGSTGHHTANLLLWLYFARVNVITIRLFRSVYYLKSMMSALPKECMEMIVTDISTTELCSIMFKNFPTPSQEYNKELASWFFRVAWTRLAKCQVAKLVNEAKGIAKHTDLRSALAKTGMRGRGRAAAPRAGGEAKHESAMHEDEDEE